MNDPSISSLLKQIKQRLGGINLYLVGMMGSGKSRTGPLLAKELGYGFVDSDVVVEEISGKSIANIFKDEGQSVFRDIETQVLNAIGQRHSLVVATGGGVVTISENWGVLHQGIVIWLDPGRERLLARLQSDVNKRPLLETNDPMASLDALLNERHQFYSEADLHLQIGDESPETVASQIVYNLPSILRNPYAPNG